MQIGSRPLDKVYAELIKPIRNRMRAYQYNSVLDSLLRYLSTPATDDKVKDLQRLPWVAERLILWLLADNPSQYKNMLIDDKSLNQLIHLAWDSMSSLYKKDIQVRSAKLFVRQLLLSQIPHQVNLNSHAFALQLYLVSKLNTSSNLRKYLDKRAGMSIEQYFQIALIFWAHTITQQPWFNGEYINSLQPMFSKEELNVFLNSITFRRHDLQKIFSERTIELEEWFQPVTFYKTPCILHENTIIPFGRPALRRFFENLVGDWLAEENGKCLQAYDDMVYEYVKFGLQRSGAKFLEESEIKKLTSTTKRVCDFLIDTEDAYVLIEVKNKSLTKSVPSSSHPPALKARLKATVISAKEQLDATMGVCELQPQFSGRTCYRIIVTYNDLWLGGIEGIVENSEEEKPIWLMSLADIDCLVELTLENRTTFSDFFRDYSERQKTAEFSVFSMGMLFEKEPYRSKVLPAHLVVETDKVFNKLINKLKN